MLTDTPPRKTSSARFLQSDRMRTLDLPQDRTLLTILKQGEAGLTTAELCRQHGISEQTYYRWKAKYGGMDSGEAKRLKQLEDENRKLKHVVAELTLDNRALKDVLSKNW